MQRVLDEIDELVDDQLENGPFTFTGRGRQKPWRGTKRTRWGNLKVVDNGAAESWHVDSGWVRDECGRDVRRVWSWSPDPCGELRNAGVEGVYPWEPGRVTTPADTDDLYYREIRRWPVPVSRPDYSKAHRCPGWSGPAWRMDPYGGDHCRNGYVEWSDPHRYRGFGRCRECRVLVLPTAVRLLDPSNWRWQTQWIAEGLWHRLREWVDDRAERRADADEPDETAAAAGPAAAGGRHRV